MNSVVMGTTFRASNFSKVQDGSLSQAVRRERTRRAQLARQNTSVDSDDTPLDRLLEHHEAEEPLIERERTSASLDQAKHSLSIYHEQGYNEAIACTDKRCTCARKWLRRSKTDQDFGEDNGVTLQYYVTCEQREGRKSIALASIHENEWQEMIMNRKVLLKALPFALSPLNQAALCVCWRRMTDNYSMKKTRRLFTDIFNELFNRCDHINKIICGAAFAKQSSLDGVGISRSSVERKHAERLIELVDSILEWMNASRRHEMRHRAQLLGHIVTYARGHVCLEKCGFNGEAIELFGEVMVEKLMEVEMIKMTPLCRPAWIKLFAFLTDQMRCYYDMASAKCAAEEAKRAAAQRNTPKMRHSFSAGHTYTTSAKSPRSHVQGVPSSSSTLRRSFSVDSSPRSGWWHTNSSNPSPDRRQYERIMEISQRTEPIYEEMHSCEQAAEEVVPCEQPIYANHALVITRAIKRSITTGVMYSKPKTYEYIYNYDC